MRLFTIGYSRRSLDEVIGMLREHDVPTLVDVRMWANSRFKPEFSKNRLAAVLEDAGIAYVYVRALGNAGKFSGAGRVVINDPENGYTELAALLERHGAVAIMCLERDPRECHRMVVAVEMARRLPGLEVSAPGGAGGVVRLSRDAYEKPPRASRGGSLVSGRSSRPLLLRALTPTLSLR